MEMMKVGLRTLLLEDQQQAAVIHHHPEEHFHMLHFFREALEHLLHAFAHAFIFLQEPHFPPPSLHHWLSFCLTAAIPTALLLLLAYCCCCGGGGYAYGPRYWSHGPPGRPWGGGWGRFHHRPGSFWADPGGYFRNLRFRKKDPNLF